MAAYVCVGSNLSLACVAGAIKDEDSKQISGVNTSTCRGDAGSLFRGFVLVLLTVDITQNPLRAVYPIGDFQGVGCTGCRDMLLLFP